MRKATCLVLVLFFLTVFNIFASDTVAVDKNTTHIVIENADTLYTLENLVVLNGNVQISFQQLNSSTKTLKANKVVVELDKKR